MRKAEAAFRADRRVSLTGIVGIIREVHDKRREAIGVAMVKGILARNTGF